MRVYRDAWSRSDLPAPTVLTIGNYDGLHRGQRAVLERVTERAAALAAASAVVTFEPHPREVLAPAEPVPSLTTAEQKEELLAAAGVEALVEVAFTAEVAATSAEAFVAGFLAARLVPREVYVGAGFTFGRGRRGDLALLGRLGAEHGFTAAAVPEVAVDGARVSSTRIREAVAGGRLDEARRLLGRAYALRGRVVRGAGRGRELGWPTANLAIDNELLPADGVYAAGLRLLHGDGGPGEVAAGVANIGVRPTVEAGGARTVEIHLFALEDEIYGARAELLVCRRLREERRFGSVGELAAQIARDAAAAREYFATENCWTEKRGRIS